MKKTLRKSLVLVLSLAMILVLVAACADNDSNQSGNNQTGTTTNTGGGNATEQTGDIMRMLYIMPGAPSLETDSVNVAINEQLAADGVPIDFQTRYIPWGEWADATNLMLSVGEEFELLHIMGDWIPLAVYASRNNLTPLDSLIDQYTPSLWDMFEPVFWQAASVGGQVMGIPAHWRDNSGDIEGLLTVRGDLFEEFNLDIPETFDEIIASLSVLQSEWEAIDGMKRFVWEHSLDRPPIAFHRTYDTWPFFVSDGGIFKVSQDGTAEMWFDSEEFKKDANFMRAMYEAGLIHPDILNFPHDHIVELREHGDMLLAIQTPLATQADLERLGIDGWPQRFWLNDSGPFLTATPLMNSNAIPNTTPHPEAALLFLEWMYSSAEAQHLVLYGVEGEHWNRVGSDERRHVRDSDGVTPLYIFDYWMIERVKWHLYDADQPEAGGGLTRIEYIENTRPDQTVVSPVVGFNFDSSSVNTELVNVLAEYTASILPIKLGVVAYDDAFEAARANMIAAGAEALLAEYQKQMTEHIANNR